MILTRTHNKTILLRVLVKKKKAKIKDFNVCGLKNDAKVFDSIRISEVMIIYKFCMIYRFRSLTNQKTRLNQILAL